jgi:gliding motility-associated-like protein
MIRIVFFCLCLLSFTVVSAQGEFNNWYFGQQGAISFSGGAPVALNNSAMSVSEGCASISDAGGNLLFYTDGTKIWNRNHTTMFNGSGITGDPSTTQGCLIVPVPNSNTTYYLFVLTDQIKAGDLSYSIIDMTLDGGRGGVVGNSKNIFVTSEQTEKLVAAKATSCGVWVISHGRLDGGFEARLVTASGIGDPVFSPVGSIHFNSVGTMKVSRDNLHLAVAIITGSVELFDFDPTTGKVSNPVNLPVTSQKSTYSACFSSDNTKLYVAEGDQSGVIDIYQFELSIADPAAIASSKTLVSTTNGQLAFVDIQIAPDDKLYVSKVGLNCLGVIPNPNLKAPLCGYVDKGICLGSKMASLCLPNDIRIQNNPFEAKLGRDTVLCPGDSYALNAPAGSINILWSNGATSPSINVNASGLYWIKANNGTCTDEDTVNIQFTGNRVNLGTDTAICGPVNFLVDAGNFQSYLWNDNSTSKTLNINAPGFYWVQVTDRCGITSRDSVVVKEKVYPIAGNPDRVRCMPDTVILHGPDNFISYLWSPNYEINNVSFRNVIVQPSADTTYYLKAEKTPGCFAYDTVRVKVRSAQQVTLVNNINVCAGEMVKIDATNAFLKYLWSTGSTSSFIDVDKRGPYWVQVTDANGCASRDTVTIEWTTCPVAFWAPSAFTPNGDGKNEKFKIEFKGYMLQYELKIFNRWGQSIFESHDVRQSWDGTYKGQKLKSDSYVWMCSYQFFGEEKKLKRGTVTLIR